MLDQYYDSYGYKPSEAFITTAELRDIKFSPVTRVERKRTELQAFFSEQGQEIIDLRQSPLLLKQPVTRGHDYANDYLTLEILEDGTITFSIGDGTSKEDFKSFSYSLDNGKNWFTTVNTHTGGGGCGGGGGIIGRDDGKILDSQIIEEKQDGFNNDEYRMFEDWFFDSGMLMANAEHIGVSIDVSAGDKILWKANATRYKESYFESTCKFNVSGNIMSMVYGDDFAGKTTLPTESTMITGLFIFTDVVDASKLILPATKLTSFCYEGMFHRCESLVKAPELPAKDISILCYREMFSGCISLTNAPKLPATTLADECYTYMFNGCESLTEAPELPATELCTMCYAGMFEGCTSLTRAPELPATTLGSGCYQEMFAVCTSLTKAPQLPVRELSDWCYCAMFGGCTSLTEAPLLPATTLAEGCYCEMFAFCTSLTEAPVLPATVLLDYCYEGMFIGCESLNYVKCLATEFGAESTSDWLVDVAETGTFVKKAGVEWGEGESGIPEDWTVEEV